jgi:hypothetical protein
MAQGKHPMCVVEGFDQTIAQKLGTLIRSMYVLKSQRKPLSKLEKFEVEAKVRNSQLFMCKDKKSEV